MPIELDDGDVGGGEDGVEGWEGVEECVFDDLNGGLEFALGFADDGPGDEDIVDPIYDGGSGFEGEFVDGFEVEGVGDGRNAGEWQEAV